jgi:hypothetical protein
MYNLAICQSTITPEILDNINNCIINLGNPAGLLPYQLLNRSYVCSPLFMVNKTECMYASYVCSMILRRYHYNIRQAHNIEELQVNEVLNLKFNVPTEYHYITITRIDENTFRIYNAWGATWIDPFDIARDTWINTYNEYLHRIITIGRIPTIANAIIFNDLIYNLTHYQLNFLTQYNDAPDDDDDIDPDYEGPTIYNKEDLLDEFFKGVVSDTRIQMDIYSMPGAGLGYKRKHIKKRKPKTKKNTKRRNTKRRNTKKRN